MSTKTPQLRNSAALKVAAALWVVWGLVHMAAGVLTMTNDAPEAVAAIADGADTDTLLAATYPDAAGALINQHGFNLLWIGAFTLVSGWFIWRGSLQSALLAGLVGGLTDVGYFVFMDLGGFVNFAPGTVMTIVSASAVILTIWVWSSNRDAVAAPVGGGVR